jgi:hypothetical protein
LAQNCWNCHGPDEKTREAGLRLDQFTAATSARGDSPPAIVPHQPDRSPVWQRVTSTDPELVMPPPSTKRSLDPAQRELLRRWIEQGADFARHWAFTPPARPKIPDSDWKSAGRGPLDFLVHAELSAKKLRPASAAPRTTLLRRLAFDLTGLPPHPDQVEELLADEGPDALDRATDRLLASPRYAERMTTYWLDAARYADTNGYNNDEERSMWPWRDWVIAAFRRQMPFDQFVSEQMAGDLIPQATLEQKVATAFHRNHVLTTEGGIIEEEYRIEYVADRVHTTSTVLLGLSLQCARCHDHKYDPFSQREYYQFFAFFNQLPHTPVGYARGGLADPSIKTPSVEQAMKLAELDQLRTAAEAALQGREKAADAEVARWEATLSAEDRQALGRQGLRLHVTFDQREGEKVLDAVEPARQGTVRGPAKWAEGKVGESLAFDGGTHVDFGDQVALEADAPFSLAAWVMPTVNEASTVLSKMDDAQAYRGYDVILESGKVSCHLIDHWPDNGLKVVTREPMSLNEWHHVLVTYDGGRKAAGVRIFVDGKPTTLEVERDQLRGTLKTDKPFHIGKRHASVPFRGRIDEVRVYGFALTADDATRLVKNEPVSALAGVLEVPAEQRDEKQRRALVAYYLESVDPQSRAARATLTDLPNRRSTLEKAIPAVMVMQDMPQPRETRVLKRGQYDQPADLVSAGVPEILPRLPADVPANRLGLARWLFDPQHPLTARVAVNRWWELYFGLGIVETLEDFGVTGALPSHPQVLDWLATELIASGWDTLAIQRAIVTSATYRQDARVTPEALKLDPKNQWLARGPRFRLSAEMVRDNALAIAGLLVDQVGGPSVKPYQPDGLWEDVSVERRAKYQADAGAGLYRRGMYTFWKRTCPPPSLSTFDAPSRETCVIRRARTNTPLQALVLMNDPTYVEAARKFAERVLQDVPSSLASGSSSDAARDATLDERRVSRAVLTALGRPPRDVERQVLLETLAAARQRFTSTAGEAEKLAAVGRAPVAATLSTPELAAWTVVCDLLLNLDETITKP